MYYLLSQYNYDNRTLELQLYDALQLYLMENGITILPVSTHPNMLYVFNGEKRAEANRSRLFDSMKASDIAFDILKSCYKEDHDAISFYAIDIEEKKIRYATTKIFGYRQIVERNKEYYIKNGLIEKWADYLTSI